VDTLLIQPAAGPVMQAEGLTCDGLFGFWRERAGKMAVAVLVRGTRLAKGSVSVTLPAAEYRGEVVSCDWANSALTVAPAPPDLASLPGRHVRLTNEAGSSASYQIKGAKAVPGGCRLAFALDPRLGEGLVQECSDGRVTSAIVLKKAQHGYYDGKALVSEDGSAVYRLKAVTKGRTCVIDETKYGKVPAGKLREQFVDKDGDGLVRFVIYDYGVGDAATIESFAVVEGK
jgi:hypothetical protein